MEGFFQKTTTASLSVSNTGKIYTCQSCGLYKNRRSPKMKPFGEFRKGIMNIGEAPGVMEDRRGEPFVGRGGQILSKVYRELGVDLKRDCLNMYACHCLPLDDIGEYRQPLPREVESCRRTTIQMIKKYKPKVIVLLGKAAIYSVIGYTFKGSVESVEKWRGWAIPDQELETWIVPVYDPIWVQTDRESSYPTIFKNDLKKVTWLVEQPLRRYKEPVIEYIDDLSPLSEITSGSVAFDYETTGLKPHSKGHRIICASVADSENHVYSFMIPSTKAERQPLLDLLTNPNVKKRAHNMKYEHAWSSERLKIEVFPWEWDSMQFAHIQDYRPGVTGLKFQSYVQMGVSDYSSEISPYLRAQKEGSNEINQVNKLLELPGGKEKLLKYCALDSVYEYRLAELQLKMLRAPEKYGLNPKVAEAYQLFHEGILSFARSEKIGFHIDNVYLENQIKLLQEEIRDLETMFKQSDFYSDWSKQTHTRPNIYSGKQLREYLYKILKLTPPKRTKSDLGSTDEEALKYLSGKVPELNKLLDIRKIEKIIDVLQGFSREQYRGKLHPFYNLHLVRTFRSSSDSPNFQNIPKRNKRAMKLTRRSIYPRPGHQLVEYDYSGIEVRIGAAYHQDPMMLKYINDPTSDMHGDMAEEILGLKIDKSIPGHKTLRSATKNGFVFPQFYGSYYKKCAESIACTWGELEKKRWRSGQGIFVSDNDGYLSDVLLRKGLKSYTDFEAHLRQVEDHFWNERFRVYNQWKKRWWNMYLKRGYVDTFTGFRYSGPLSFNDVCNYPIQGSAFHCLLWSYNQVDKQLMKRNSDTHLIGQIHDALILDMLPDESIGVDKLVREISTLSLREHWKWINVPLDIDKDLFPVDQSWAVPLD